MAVVFYGSGARADQILMARLKKRWAKCAAFHPPSDWAVPSGYLRKDVSIVAL